MSLRVACAQVNPKVGDIAGNAAIVAEAMAWADREQADVLLLPELVITGYPPEDLVLRDEFVEDGIAAVDALAARSGSALAVVGFVGRVDDEAEDVDEVEGSGGGFEDSRPRRLANAAALMTGGRIVGVYHKVLLPNYGVFDEARYFAAGDYPDRVWDIAGIPVGISICEDIWGADGPHIDQVAAGARVLLNINGSPYHRGKGQERFELISGVAASLGVPVVYLNMVGGQDELVFDGDSMAFDAAGELLHRAGQFTEERFVLDLPVDEGRAGIVAGGPPRLDEEEEVYSALVTGLGDYVRKNGFSGVVVGLSGGIDSALTAAIACDAVGPDAVWGVSMPARYSSEGSWADSEELAKRLGCRFDVIPIDGIFQAYLESLAPIFEGTTPGTAEENLQARIRGAVLMALSNKYGPMVVATGNKSELAVGYATLYGDMAGGYAVLKDVFKTLVYDLARWRNGDGEVIPEAIIAKPPSAELRPDQRDSDSLPEYPLLDEILRRYVEEDESLADMAAAGLDPALVRTVVAMVDRNEYKRRQAPPGVRITRKGFGKDRRVPITSGYDEDIPVHAGFVPVDEEAQVPAVPVTEDIPVPVGLGPVDEDV
ncbi:MAG: NAD+ synthase [Actinomycetota bacterium]|nr:NAD+ synthase [Actinomycetota bacterium]